MLFSAFVDATLCYLRDNHGWKGAFSYLSVNLGLLDLLLQEYSKPWIYPGSVEYQQERIIQAGERLAAA